MPRLITIEAARSTNMVFMVSLLVWASPFWIGLVDRKKT
jgi:hypothetical protein